jgi:hypothetical protein
VVPEIDQPVLRPQRALQEGVTKLLFKISDLRAGKRGIYKPNFTSSKGNLLKRKEGVGVFFFRLRKRWILNVLRTLF